MNEHLKQITKHISEEQDLINSKRNLLRSINKYSIKKGGNIPNSIIDKIKQNATILFDAHFQISKVTEDCKYLIFVNICNLTRTPCKHKYNKSKFTNCKLFEVED